MFASQCFQQLFCIKGKDEHLVSFLISTSSAKVKIEKKMNILSFSLVALCLIVNVQGHGRLIEPPSRSSMFRFAYSDPVLFPHRDIIQPNYNDHQLNCGGRKVQIRNNGNCGVCGDSYTAPVKENEAGGKYALGIITRNYIQGHVIDVTVEITAEHKGYFEFRLCPWNNVELAITHECLNQYLLHYEDGATKWYLPENPIVANGLHHLRIQLPKNVTCLQCVLQWRYRTGNSWGNENEKQGIGLGQQEEFYGCSDISITEHGNSEEASIISTTSFTSSAFSTTTLETIPTTTTLPLNENSRPISSGSTSKVISLTHSSSEAEENTKLYPGFNCSQVQLGQPIFRDCHSFYICAFAQYDPYVFSCPEETLCHPENGRCLQKWDVPMCNNF